MLVWNLERGISLIKSTQSQYKKAFYKKLLIIALPIILQNLIASSLNFLDTFMIGKLGEVELAAVGIANQFYFLFNLLIFGLSAGCAVFIAQLWGKEDVRNIRNVLLRADCSASHIKRVYHLRSAVSRSDYGDL